jgi:hypothetical protein
MKSNDSGRSDLSTHFLNVDLDIYSKSDLQPIVAALGTGVNVLYLGPNGKGHCAHLEICKRTKGADATIREFCRILKALPEPARKLWNAATVRSFSIGIQAGKHPNPCDFKIDGETLKAVASLSAEIVITVYPVPAGVTD